MKNSRESSIVVRVTWLDSSGASRLLFFASTPIMAHVGDGYFFNFEKLAYIQGDRPPGCILCGIRDRVPGVTNLSVARSAYHQVCLNLYPFNPGHLLIFPLAHRESLQTLDEAEDVDLMRVSKICLGALEKTFDARAFNAGWNLGRDAGASISHIHLHIIPRYPRETGMADLIAGRRVLVEHPGDSAARLRKALAEDGRLEIIEP